MNDLENELRAAFGSYARSVNPTRPTDDGEARIMKSARRDPIRIVGLVAAMALVAALVPVLVLISQRRSSGDDPSPPMDPAQQAGSRVGTWTTVPHGPLSPRKRPSIVWTGTEFIVWGGSNGAPNPLSDGAAFDPATGSWRMIAQSPAHPGANAVWAEDRMIVLAGASGFAYHPGSDEWSSLPSIELPTGAQGFTDAVWSGGQLLALAVAGNYEVGGTFTAWRLSSSLKWENLGNVAVDGPSFNDVRHIAVEDQFFVHDPIATGDGFVVPRPDGRAWLFSTARGWSEIPSPGYANLGRSSFVWADGALFAVAADKTPAGTDVVSVNRWGVEGWSGFAKPMLLSPFARAVAVDSRIALVGGTIPDSEPVLVDPSSESVLAVADAPLHGEFDQGAAWSGSGLFLWGGQLPSTEAAQSTDDPGSLSASGAIWTP